LAQITLTKHNQGTIKAVLAQTNIASENGSASQKTILQVVSKILI